MARSRIFDFELSNPIYANALVTFWVAASGVKTTEKVRLYTGMTGPAQASNPQTLNAHGRLNQPLYHEQALIATVSGSYFPSHDTGFIVPSHLVTPQMFGAVGNGVDDDTAAIQAALAAAKEVYFPEGTYLVAPSSIGSFPLADGHRIRLGNAVIQASAASSIKYVFLANDVSDVEISGGTVIGARATDTGTIIGIGIRGSSRVSVRNTVVRDFSLDNVYIGDGLTTSTDSTDVTLDNVHATNAKRNNMSVTGGSAIKVLGGAYNGANGSNPMCGIDIEPNAPNLGIDISIIGVEASGNDGTGIQVYGATAAQVIISGNKCRGNGVDGIRIGSSSLCTVADNQCTGNTGNGIIVDTVGGVGGSASENTVTGNTCSGNTLSGIWLDATQSTAVDFNAITGNVCKANGQDGIRLSHAVENTVTGNVCEANTRHGVLVEGSTTLGNDVSCNQLVRNVQSGLVTATGAGEMRISGNVIRYNGRHGIRLQTIADSAVQGNTCHGNGTETDATYDNIILESAVDRCNLQGNICRRGAGANKPRYGINVANANCDANVVSNNDLTTGGTTGDLVNSGTGTVVRNNTAWITEASGTGSIASGATTAVVTHGLSVTPTVDDISIVFGEQGTADYGRWWVSTITSTQFTLNVSVDPGVSNLDFGWRAVVL